MNNKRSFRFLWIGQTLANCGDVIYIVGVLSFLHALTGSVTMMALVPFVNTFCRFWGGITAPLVMDRFSLKRVLAYSQLMKTLLLVVMTVYLMRLEGAVYGVFLFIGLIAFLDGWATPSRNAMLPRLVEEEQLLKANSFVSVVDQVVQLGGWPLGGILAAVFGGEVLVAVTLVLFTLSTLLMFLLHDRSQHSREATATNKWDSIKEGWVAIWRTPALRTVAVMDLLDSIAGVVWIAAILYIYVEQVLQKSEAWWGYINSAFVAGLIVGGLLTLKGEAVLRKRLAAGIVAGSLLVAAFTLWFGLTTVPWVALLMSLLVGVATEIKMISQLTVIQFHTPQPLLPKVFSARDAILTGVFGVASLLFGYLTDLFGVQAVFLLGAALCALSGLWAWGRRKHLTAR